MRRKAKTDQEKRAETSLQRAERIAPNFEFVISCRKFYTERGFLSDKQVKALDSIQERGYRMGVDLSRIFGDGSCPNGLFDFEDDWDFDGFDPTDLYD
jgi:hypothetical protein